ncbi:MAG: hypothetical protein Q8M03_05110 [Legionella sp.]|nr:hypothetical protein [Legionella sp.]
MSYLNYDLINSIHEDDRQVFGYYPDMLVYQHDASQYEAKWRQLATSSYIYTDGYDLKPVGLLRFCFESVKGWFGFTNHCREHLVQLSLRKFAYYGYLQGYSQNTALSLTNYPFPILYQDLIQNPRTNQRSKEIQTHLVNYYVEHTGPSSSLSSDHVFGTTFSRLGYWHLIPELDPQNLVLIHSIKYYLEPEDKPPSPYKHLRGSRYAHTIAQHYLEKARAEKSGLFYSWSLISDGQIKAQYYLERAFYFNPECARNNKILYIDYFLEKKDFTNALLLIVELENTEQAINYLTEKFSESQQRQFVQPNSKLALALSSHYLKKDNNLPTLRFAAFLDSKFHEHDPANGFKLFIAEKQYEKAYALFNAHKSSPFFKSDLHFLADYFNTLGETQYDKGLKFKKASDWKNAETSYSQSLEEKKKACVLQPVQYRIEQCNIHKRLYAQLIIERDISENAIEHCAIAKIIKAITLLDSCILPKREILHHQRALAKGLMRQVDYLTHQFEVPATYADDYSLRKQHQSLHQNNFKWALDRLQRVVDLLKDTNVPDLKLLLGKAYFLLGDINLFFDLPSNNPHYFKMAMQTVPNNPFYLLRCSEVFAEQKDKLQNKAIPLLKAQGFTALDYYHSDNARWERDTNKNTAIREIHFLQEAQKNSGWNFNLPF